jgi:2'-5' RNA ligase
MSEAVRSFIAFDLNNEAVLKSITSVQNLLVKTGADLKPVEPENIHVTVRFLGDISPSMVDNVHDAMKKVHFAPFEAKISGIGAFPNVNYPRVIWAGMTQGADQVQSIFSQLEPHLNELGFAPDPKGFSPHLTIARVRSGRNKPALITCLRENSQHEFGVIKAECLRLKKSELTPKGPIYSTLREHCPK